VGMMTPHVLAALTLFDPADRSGDGCGVPAPRPDTGTTRAGGDSVALRLCGRGADGDGAGVDLRAAVIFG